MRLPPAWANRAQRLLHDQCWCWGRDVERSQGNLLIEFGFRRVPTPEGRAFAYDLEHAGERMILAGAGLCYGAPSFTQAALLGRYDVRPRLLPRSEVDVTAWATLGPSAFHSSGTRDEGSALGHLLLAGAVRWIGAYEAWVRQAAGIEYRDACLATWSYASVSGDGIVEAWAALLTELEDFATTTDADGEPGMERNTSRSRSRGRLRQDSVNS